MSRLLREPLVHFLLLGVLLFVVFGVAGPGGGDLQDRRIVVTEAAVQRIVATWQRQWGRSPSDRELAHLVEQHIREEVLYREAMALGLDQNDSIVRRRLVQKLEFLSEDLAVPREPATEDLEAFFASEIERYRVPKRLSFTHVYLSRDRRGDRVEADAASLLAKLRRSDEERAPAMGDRFMLQYDFVRKSEAEIGRDFGSSFAAALIELDGGGWEGPVESGYGLHLVRVSERSPSRLPALEDVRKEVTNDYTAHLRKQANESFYSELRARYDISLQEPVEVATEPVEEPISEAD